MDTTHDDFAAKILTDASVPLDVFECTLPVVFCTPDERPPGRRHWNQTVSFYCALCRRRHFHGSAGRRTEPGDVIGVRSAHCDTSGPRLGDYELVVGPEQWQPPVRRRKPRAASSVPA